MRRLQYVVSACVFCLYIKKLKIMKRDLYVNPDVEIYAVRAEAGFGDSLTGGDDNTGSFDGEWVPIG